MEKKPGAIVLVIGGALMAVGSFLTWLTASVDLNAVAAAIKEQIGVDVSGVPGFADSQQSFSAAGTKGWEGKLALVVGIVALAIGIALIVGNLAGAVASKVALAAGTIGVLVAVEAMLTKSSGLEGAKAASSSQLAGVGLTPSVFDNAFKISVGIGLYLTIVGGIVAIVAGVMLMGKDAPAATMTSGAAPMAGSGFGAPAPTPPPMPSGSPIPPPTGAPSTTETVVDPSGDPPT